MGLEKVGTRARFPGKPIRREVTRVSYHDEERYAEINKEYVTSENVLAATEIAKSMKEFKERFEKSEQERSMTIQNEVHALHNELLNTKRKVYVPSSSEDETHGNGRSRSRKSRLTESSKPRRAATTHVNGRLTPISPVPLTFVPIKPPSVYIHTLPVVKYASDIPMPKGPYERTGKYVVLYTSDDSDSSVDVDGIDCDEKVIPPPKLGKSVIKMNSYIPVRGDEANSIGVPVITDKSLGAVPPKPLCFGCGSAGIDQLIYCSNCCEPYHPYCTDDDTLFSTYLTKILPRIKAVSESTAKRKSTTTDSSLLLSPPPTPQVIENELEAERDRELFQFLTLWRCRRCYICYICHERKSPRVITGQADFLKCLNCPRIVHSSCTTTVKKTNLNWICDECLKCRSCGKRVDRKSASAASNSNVLCLECFRQKQKGSFCPVCEVCYDDDDYETRMMECGKCTRWVHAKCEKIGEEEYQVLSHLPESIEYICRLCEVPDITFWRHAVLSELRNGCKSILSLFRQKSINSCRKILSKTPLCADTAEDFSSAINSSSHIVRNLFGDALREVSDEKCDTLLSKLQSSKEIVPRNEEMEDLFFAKSTETKDLTSPSITNDIPTVPTFEEYIKTKFCLQDLRVVLDDYAKRPNMATTALPEKSSIAQIKDVIIILQDCMAKPTLSESTPEIKSDADHGHDGNSGDVFQSVPPLEDMRIPCETLPKLEESQVLPVKFPSAVAEIKREVEVLKTPVRALTDVHYSPSKEINSILDSVAQILEKSSGSIGFPSVLTLYKEMMSAIHCHAKSEDSCISNLRSHFEFAVYEVFPWFNAHDIEAAMLKSQSVQGQNSLTSEISPYFTSGYSYSTARNEGTPSTRRIDAKLVLQVFSDTLWDPMVSTDGRRCSLCHELGDFPPESSGRLLWAGLSEWVHVNCALWSNDVTEAEDGALMKVGSVISRGRTTYCCICNKKGASLACVSPVCRRNFHFPCALNGSCTLLESKDVFCLQHSDKSKGTRQEDMQVLRQVYVEPFWLNKKGIEPWSSNITVCIGSLRIESLGNLVPISTQFTNGKQKNIIPLGFQASRFYWSVDEKSNGPLKTKYTVNTKVKHGTKRRSKYCRPPPDINFRVDHSKSKPQINRKLKQIEAFHNWLKSQAGYIDEYLEEWLPPCRLQFSDTEPSDVAEDFDDIDGGRIKKSSKKFEPIIPEEVFQRSWTGDELSSLPDLHLNPDDLEWGLEMEFEGSGDEVDTEAETDVDENLAKEMEMRRNTELGKVFMIPQVDGGGLSSSDETGDDDDSTSSSESSDDNEIARRQIPTRSTTSSSRRSRPKPPLTSKPVTSKISNSIPANRTTKSFGGRALRSRQKLKEAKLESAKKEEFKCPQCKKSLPSKTSVNRHSKWCKPKKTYYNSKKRRAEAEVNEASDSTKYLPKPKKRGRKPINQKMSSDSDSDSPVNVKAESTLPGDSSHSRSASMPTQNSKEMGKYQEIPDGDGKVRCSFCKNTYRTVESYKNHIGNCYFYSSDDEDDGVDEAKSSAIHPPQIAAVSMQSSQYKGKSESDMSTDTETSCSTTSVSLSDEPCAQKSPEEDQRQCEDPVGENGNEIVETSVEVESEQKSSRKTHVTMDPILVRGEDKKSDDVDDEFEIGQEESTTVEELPNESNELMEIDESGVVIKEEGFCPLESDDNYTGVPETPETTYCRVVDFQENRGQFPQIIQPPVREYDHIHLPEQTVLPSNSSNYGFANSAIGHSFIEHISESQAQFHALTIQDATTGQLVTIQLPVVQQQLHHANQIQHIEVASLPLPEPAQAMKQLSTFPAVNDCVSIFHPDQLEQFKSQVQTAIQFQRESLPEQAEILEKLTRPFFQEIQIYGQPGQVELPISHNRMLVHRSHCPATQVKDPLIQHHSQPNHGLNPMSALPTGKVSYVILQGNQGSSFRIPAAYDQQPQACVTNQNYDGQSAAVVQDVSSLASMTSNPARLLPESFCGITGLDSSTPSPQCPKFCVCSNCLQPNTVTTFVTDPNQLAAMNWLSKQHNSVPPQTKKIKSGKSRFRLESIASERQGQGLQLFRSMTTPSATLPKLLPATTTSVIPVPTTTFKTPILTIHPTSSVTTITSDSISAPLVSTPFLLKAPTPSPNVAVVRPMEHPLQKISDQIQQLETHVAAAVALNPVPSNYAVQTASPSIPIIAGQEVRNDTLAPQISNPVNSSTDETKTQEDALTAQPNLDPSPVKDNLQDSPTRDKSIKIQLKRQQGGNSYSINKISGPAVANTEFQGMFKTLKIKGKITTGDQAGTSTDVVVQPMVYTVPIPDPDVPETSESNRTIQEDENSEGQSSVSAAAPVTLGSDAQLPTIIENVPLPRSAIRLTHRAVIVYEVKIDDKVQYKSCDVRAVWGYILERVQGTRRNHNLPPLSYPATNISLPENKREAAASFNKLGLTHRAVQFLLEQLPGISKAAKEGNVFKFQDQSTKNTFEEIPITENPGMSARCQGFTGRKPFDMFGWLTSKHRYLDIEPKYIRSFGQERIMSANLPIAMKYRNMHKLGTTHLNVFCSGIHGRGLFTSKDIECGDMVIEYAGQIIRSVLCDIKEKYYESRGIGCYMFRIDDNWVVDATLRGNAARFINHSCDPNCHSKIEDINGKKHILIFALRRIIAKEELTYDYKFEVEEGVKLPCTCGTTKCRKFLN